MRRHRTLWLVAAVVMIGLWAWTRQPYNDTLREPGELPVAALPGIDAAPSTDRIARRPIDPAKPDARRYPAFLPPQAHGVLDDIARGGPYDYRQDGAVFHNRERRLPPRPRGYYREYTVPTPGSDDRGPRRIVTGGGVPGESGPSEYWYSDDHYRSFRAFEIEQAGQQ